MIELEPPVILNGDVLEVLEDREITLECISKVALLKFIFY